MPDAPGLDFETWEIPTLHPPRCPSVPSSLFPAFSQPALGIQQLTLIQRPDVAGQLVGAFAFTDRLIELALDGLHLGVQVVEEVEHQGFGNHGELGRTELQLAVVREDHVQDQQLEFGREVGQGVDGFFYERHAHLNVAQQAAFDGVLKADLPTQLADLADVVEDDAGEQQVAVEERVVGRDAVGQGAEADDVLQQAAQPCVVELLGGGGFAVGLCEGRIIEYRAEQKFEVGVGEAVDAGEKLAPEGGNVIGGGGQQVGLVHFARRGLAELVDLHLQAVIEAGGAAAGLDDVALVEVPGDARVGGLPYAAFE